MLSAPRPLPLPLPQSLPKISLLEPLSALSLVLIICLSWLHHFDSLPDLLLPLHLLCLLFFSGNGGGLEGTSALSLAT